MHWLCWLIVVRNIIIISTTTITTTNIINIIVIIIQGDMERLQLNITPMGMMDRDRKDELPEMQVIFFFFQICMFDWHSQVELIGSLETFLHLEKNEILNVFLFDLVTLTTSGWIHRPDMCSSLPNSLWQVFF